jgi:hypothetical protein
MSLVLDGRVLQIVQMGPNFFVLASRFDHPPTNADLIMSIDGRESRWTVHLPAGICKDERKTTIARFNGAAAEGPRVGSL